LVYLLVKLLAGSVVLAIMVLPIITISEDAMRNTPRAMKEASLALGASHWQTIYKVIHILHLG
jgi:phosphate transport system permease protein